MRLDLKQFEAALIVFPCIRTAFIIIIMSFQAEPTCPRMNVGIPSRHIQRKLILEGVDLSRSAVPCVETPDKCANDDD